jgi:hypothetical protein
VIAKKMLSIVDETLNKKNEAFKGFGAPARIG